MNRNKTMKRWSHTYSNHYSGGSSIIIDPRITSSTRKRKYSKSDFHSNNGIMTTIWGPPTWHMLHCISFNYPMKPSLADKLHYSQFIKNLKCVLPCGKCRKNLDKNFSIHPLEKKYMASRDTFSKYVYDLHEIVNQMLGKESGLTYEDVRETYEHFRAKCAPKHSVALNQTKETGCIVPFNGRKQRCVLRIGTYGSSKTSLR